MTTASVLQYLLKLYGPLAGQEAYEELIEIMRGFKGKGASQEGGFPTRLNQADAIVITYPDQIQEPGVKPLVSFNQIAGEYLEGLVSGLHILPFFPASSDDGFAVIDYSSVDPGLGSWEEIRALGKHFRLMVDAVINHVSSQSAWFQAFREGDPQYLDYFIEMPPDSDLSQVVRPRTLPLLTPFSTSHGDKYVWTTFSADQIDLNFANPKVLLEVIKVLLRYVAEGAQLIRLDAIAYLWKEPGTTCIHLPQTHTVIRLFRALLDEVAPATLLVTETNVPHQENLSYFGGGEGEAQLVYNFALPPLILHTFLSGDAQALTEWAADLQLPSQQVTFLNFLASHDGIGLNPVRGILTPGEIDQLVKSVEKNGGLVSSKSDPGGGESPYELNVNYFDALNPCGNEPLSLQIDRFMAAHTILLSLQGLPAIYAHSLLGSRGWPEGVKQLGYKRAINRQKLDRQTLEKELGDPKAMRSQIYRRFARLLQLRAGQPAFDPYAEQQVINSGKGIFTVIRRAVGEGNPVLCLHNVTAEALTGIIPEATGSQYTAWKDLISGETGTRQRERVELGPYQARWLIPAA
jgi:sucrose phosphorylase